MSGKNQGVSAILLSKYPKVMYFHCASHKLNLCIVQACKLTSIANMMDTISCLANFFNFSPQRQQQLENYVHACCPDSLKSKLLPLGRTRWVERLDALDVMIGLMDAIHNTLISMVQQNNRTWNRDTSSQAASLSGRLDFEFLLNLHVTQSVLSFAAGLTEHLQKRGIDLVEAVEHSKQVTQTLQMFARMLLHFIMTGLSLQLPWLRD